MEYLRRPINTLHSPRRAQDESAMDFQQEFFGEYSVSKKTSSPIFHFSQKDLILVKIRIITNLIEIDKGFLDELPLAVMHKKENRILGIFI